jgi:hypothetical protein
MGDGDGANIIKNNRRAKKDALGRKVKTHVAQIIKMHKVSPRSIAYVACQVSGHFSVSLLNTNNSDKYVVAFRPFICDVMAVSRW